MYVEEKEALFLVVVRVVFNGVTESEAPCARCSACLQSKITIACKICHPSRQDTRHSMGEGRCYFSHIIWHMNLLSSTAFPFDPGLQAPASAVPRHSQGLAQLKGLEKARGKKTYYVQLFPPENKWTVKLPLGTGRPGSCSQLRHCSPAGCPKRVCTVGLVRGQPLLAPPQYNPSALPVSFLTDVYLTYSWGLLVIEMPPFLYSVFHCLTVKKLFFPHI